jgi:hypothetical protein
MKHSVEEVVLQNGSRGLLIHVPNATVMSYDFEFRAGYDYCITEGIYETPHIMEHMVLGANELFRNARQFNAELEKTVRTAMLALAAPVLNMSLTVQILNGTACLICCGSPLPSHYFYRMNLKPNTAT